MVLCVRVEGRGSRVWYVVRTFVLSTNLDMRTLSDCLYIFWRTFVGKFVKVRVHVQGTGGIHNIISEVKGFRGFMEKKVFTMHVFS